jgi:hypothetical protein
MKKKTAENAEDARELKVKINQVRVALPVPVHFQAVPQEELVRSCSFIASYSYVLSREYLQALSSSI